MSSQTTGPLPTELKLQQASKILSVNFDNGHDSGVFPWKRLDELGTSQDDNWQSYLAELEKSENT
ncbi:MAG: hypothetical protein OEX83_02605 [Gammaproteobacteria bacterium]|nr:hypothetical protein [Gammaproteobacteria bacterium]